MHMLNYDVVICIFFLYDTIADLKITSFERLLIC
jgi:hypothetical protein